MFAKNSMYKVKTIIDMPAQCSNPTALWPQMIIIFDSRIQYKVKFEIQCISTCEFIGRKEA